MQVYMVLPRLHRKSVAELATDPNLWKSRLASLTISPSPEDGLLTRRNIRKINY